eukprot:Selendium_serpulae@DN6117_c0_g1_i1.p1
MPTKEKILESLVWLVKGVKDGDALFLHFSGHGVRVPDKNGDEAEGHDESIVPLDYRTKGVIIDDILHAMLVKDLPAGVRLTIIMDCCHSGSALDLPYSFEARTEDDTKQAKEGAKNFHRDVTLNSKMDRREKANTQDAAKKKLFCKKKDLVHKCEDDDEKEMMKKVLADEDDDSSDDEEDPKGLNACRGGEVVKFSGCSDEQTSADVSSTRDFNLPDVLGPDTGGGACTSALLSISSDNYRGQTDLSYIEILERMRQYLKNKGFKQVPQLSSTIAFDLHSTFDLDSIAGN